jgi:hypothetical protein
MDTDLCLEYIHHHTVWIPVGILLFLYKLKCLVNNILFHNAVVQLDMDTDLQLEYTHHHTVWIPVGI